MAITLQSKSIPEAAGQTSGAMLINKLKTDSATIETEANRVAAKVDPVITGAGVVTLGGVPRNSWPAAGGTASGLNDVMAVSPVGNIPAAFPDFGVNDSTGNRLFSVNQITRAIQGSLPQFEEKARAQCVNLLGATSGATGISVASNINNNFGVTDFTVLLKVALPDITPATDQVLAGKHDGANGWILTLLATGYLRLIINAGIYDSTQTLSTVVNTDGTPLTIAAAITRQVSTAPGSVRFDVNGIQLGAAIAIGIGAPTTTSNSVSLYVMGDASTRTAGVFYAFYLYNYALDAATSFLAHAVGTAFSDKWGGQVELVNNGTFTGSAAGWTLGSDVTYSVNSLVFNTTSTQNGLAYQNILTVGKKYRATYRVLNYIVGSFYVAFGAGGGSGSVYANGTYTGMGIAKTQSLFLAVTSAVTQLTIDDVSVTELGATLALEGEGIQPGQIHDSANDNHASYPAAGASLMRFKETGIYQWTTPITADTALTGVVPAGYELVSILVNNSTAGVPSIKLGTTAGGTEVFAATAVAASGYTSIDCKKAWSLTAATTLYISSVAWSGASLTFTMYFRRIS